ncbi:hypothetical protein CP973_00685 [Streptomyces albofaciens JCM 4342]|uniref:hypothetical protein n=1 Tax=Streptomyces albofaciens TaxID=66866 RepID=UPI00123BEA92|nr:hypothetical protein [Streptomyces albofaciens]KAA6220704.1 hypothetical protein CP973_00685 [Streptomyces albofaciens JCM 4342]
MRAAIGAVVGALTVAATAVLCTAGTATADSRDGKISHVVPLGHPVTVGHVGHPGRHGRGVGAPDDWKHVGGKHVGGTHADSARIDRKQSAPSTAAHNWGGGNWNSKVVFGDMKLD